MILFVSILLVSACGANQDTTEQDPTIGSEQQVLDEDKNLNEEQNNEESNANDNTDTEDKQYVRDFLPFTEEDINNISIYDSEDGHEISKDVDNNQLSLIYQSLYWMKLNSASTKDFPQDQLVYIVFDTKNGEFKYPYHYETNVIGIPPVDGKSVNGFHIDKNVQRIMTLLLNPESLLGDIYNLEQRAFQERIANDISTTETDNNNKESFLINGMTDQEWQQSLEEFTIDSKTFFYDSCVEGLEEIVEYDKGIVKIGSTLVFFTDEYETIEGIMVGDSTDKVLQTLGEPNQKTSNEWSYSVGDYLRFKILIENGKVKYLIKITPC
jgi:hypothetical protein